MTDRPRRRPGQIAAGAGFGGLLGAAGFAALAADVPGASLPAWSVAGAAAMAAASGWADATRRPGRPQPVWVRAAASSLLGAIVGWLLGVVAPALPAVALGALVGGAAGASGARIAKVGLGAVTGTLAGFTIAGLTEMGAAVVAAVTILVYRSVAALLFGGRERIRIMEEAVTAELVPYVVPLAERQGYVGVDYLRRRAESTGGTFERGPADIGIVDTFDDLAGPGFDPAKVDHLVREFYEHTSRFGLSITPRWRPWMRLPYLAYRELFARPIGQANAPFQVEEVEAGIVSWIDTLDLDHDGTPEFRAWVRAYEATLEPIYVGIYTVVRHEGVGYVSVGFPLPSGSFTATLVPELRPDGGLTLSSVGGRFQGHYLSVVDPETDDISVVAVGGFDETLDVWADGQDALRAEHHFSILGVEFMRLEYVIRRT